MAAVKATASTSLEGAAPGYSVNMAAFVVDPVTAVADLQSYDGSFVLDSHLLALLQRKTASLFLDALKGVIPESVRGLANAETIWGTILAASYMMVALANDRSVWDSLWDKAQEYVCEEMSVTPFQFNRLVQVASSELK